MEALGDTTWDVVIAGTGVTVTGAPIAVAPSKKVRVPLAPVRLLLGEEIVPVSVTWVVVAMPVFGVAATAAVVAAFKTVRFKVFVDAL